MEELGKQAFNAAVKTGSEFISNNITNGNATGVLKMCADNLEACLGITAAAAAVAGGALTMVGYCVARGLWNRAQKRKAAETGYASLGEEPTLTERPTF